MGEIIRSVNEDAKRVVSNVPTYLEPMTDAEDYRNAEMLSEQKVQKNVEFFDLKQSADVFVKSIQEQRKEAREDAQVKENMKTWKMQLQSVDSKKELIEICKEIPLECLVEALKQNIGQTDDTHFMFVKQADMKAKHFEMLDQLKDDLLKEKEELQPYIEQARRFSEM